MTRNAIQSSSSSSHAPCVLVVDNDERLTETIRYRLEQSGFACDSAVTGGQAVARFAPDRTRLVVTDLNMPSLDGISFIRWVREHSDVPIVVITGFPEHFRPRLNQIGGLDVLVKPFRVSELVELAITNVSLRSPN